MVALGTAQLSKIQYITPNAPNKGTPVYIPKNIFSYLWRGGSQSGPVVKKGVITTFEQ
jgi:hypothetical protein